MKITSNELLALCVLFLVLFILPLIALPGCRTTSRPDGTVTVNQTRP